MKTVSGNYVDELCKLLGERPESKFQVCELTMGA